ncbi:MAG: diguanylate cyclase [Campylobacterota bacterium]|nr:diguanylate cyclase [Campylobacterota bacterium]
MLNTSQNQTTFILKSLYSHQNMSQTLNTLDNNDVDLNLINFQELSDLLKFNINDINTRISWDIIAKVFKKEAEHKHQVSNLHDSTLKFTNAINGVLTSSNKNSNTTLEMHNKLRSNIANLIEANNIILFQKETIISYLIYFTVFYIILITLTYTSQLASTIRDLQAVTKREPGYQYETMELDYLNNKLTKVDDSKRAEIFFDPLTKLNNLKGVLNKYSNQTLTPSYTHNIYVFGIDNYSNIDKQIAKENSQAVLKKLAFIVSLYEKDNDYVARVGFDSFVVIFPREDSNAAYQECEQLRKTVEETSFVFKGIDLKHVTVSGVFLPKPKNKTISETISYGLNFLKTSKHREINKIYKVLGFQ